MAKLINLPNGIYIKADKIISVGEAWNSNDAWHYSICHLDAHGNVTFHTVDLHATFVNNEDKANSRRKDFVSMVNENL